MPFRPYVTRGEAPSTNAPKRWSVPAGAARGGREPGPTSYAGHGIADQAALAIVRGHLEVALADLAVALTREPASAQLHNDAAVAYLERGNRHGEPLDLLAALRHSLRAVELSPGSAAALFNLGLCLDSLELRRQAIGTWHRYLALDGASAWATEVRSRLGRSSDDTFQQDWRRRREALRLHQPLDPAALREVVRRFPGQVRELIVEELLPKAASELATSSGATGPTTVLSSAIAAEMAAARGDWLLADAVSSLNRGDLVHRRRLAAAHQALAKAMALYHAQDFAAAGTLLERAVPVFRAAGSPMAWEAQLYAAICVYYTKAGQAWTQLGDLLAQIDQQRFPSVSGRALWMLGTSAMVEGRHEAATAAFHRMRSLLLRGAGADQAAVADQLLGQNYELRGEVERGWRHRLQGLHVLVPCGEPRRRYSILHEAAQALARRRQFDLALVFLDETMVAAQEWGELPGQAETLSLRARVRAELGDVKRAEADAAAALGAAVGMRPSGLRRRLVGEALVSRGRASLARDPAAALHDLERGRSLETATGWSNDSTLASTLMASAHHSLGEIQAARNSLLDAVQSYERIRNEAMETEARIAVFEHAQEAFEDLIALALEGAKGASGSLSEAFYWAERSRRRYLAESWAARRAAGRPAAVAATADAREILRRLPADVTLIEFAVLPERTIGWVAEHGTLRGRVLPISNRHLAQQVERYRQALEHDDAGARVLGAEIYDQVLRPLRPFAKPGNRLVIVPDGPLEQVPFAALFDRERGAYLVEQATLTIAPSATVLISLISRRRLASPPGSRSALIVGAPDLRRSDHDDLDRLPGAKEEARAIAGFYPHHSLLLGAEASRVRFLRELPRHGVLHFAGHALALAGSGQSSLFLLAPSPGDDGEISAADLRTTHLPAMDLVVLAACQSLAGYSAGREGTLSLASAFLAAGVPSVVAAWWKVDDRTTPQLMRRFHALVASGTDPPAALRRVMLDCLRSGDRELASPRTWAVFTALGV